jgi:hypothetical protein
VMGWLGEDAYCPSGGLLCCIYIHSADEYILHTLSPLSILRGYCSRTFSFLSMASSLPDTCASCKRGMVIQAPLFVNNLLLNSALRSEAIYTSETRKGFKRTCSDWSVLKDKNNVDLKFWCLSSIARSKGRLYGIMKQT